MVAMTAAGVSTFIDRVLGRSDRFWLCMDICPILLDKCRRRRTHGSYRYATLR